MNKIVDPNVVANAYTKSSNIATAKVAGSGDDGVSFSDFMRDNARESIGTLKSSERMSALAVTGDADLVDVVQAVTNAEVTLNTVVAIRDRMVSAYQEILRMPM